MRKAKKLVAFCIAAMMVLSAVLVNVPATRVYAASAAVSVTESGGWFESAYVKWNEVSGSTAYRVYVKEASAADTAYVQLDDELIRKYPTYWRADALGLKAGSYVLKVEAVTADGTVSAVTGALSVSAYDRSGFTFSSGCKYASAGIGAYNNDGTLKGDASVLYVTEENKNTVTLTISGKEYTGVANITQAIKTKNNCQPVAIRIIGQVTMDGLVCGDMSSFYAIGVKEAENVTFEGVGDDATLYTAGVAAIKSNSIEVRNLGLMNWGGGSDGDGIALQKSIGVWIHNNDVFYGNAGSDGDQAKGDGSMDLKDDSKYVTVSYNHFWDSGKMSLCGMKSESGENWITYHHNWFDHSDSRHPRIRTMSVHVYNNYYDGNSKYGVGAAKSSEAFVESNVFRNCRFPMLSSAQGSDVEQKQNMFGGEAGGIIKAYNNKIEGAEALIYANSDAGTAAANATSFDAYLAASRAEEVPSTYKALSGGRVYSNFDTKVDLGVKESAITPVDSVVSVVTQSAGRMNGGDFKWTFNNAVDDESYDLNAPLKTAINNYKTSLVSVGGDAQAASVTKYTVSVTGGTATATKAAEGTTVTITATPVSGQNFTGWTVTSGGAVLTDASSATTTFVMPAANVSITANYSGNGSGGGNEGGGTVVPGGDYECTFAYDGSVLTVLNSKYTAAKNGGAAGGVKGKSVTYAGTGITYTQGIKMETGTTVTFTAPSSGKLIVVTDAASKGIYLNGTKEKTDANGVLEKAISAAGQIVIAKGDSMNVVYINFIPDGSGSDTSVTEYTVTVTGGTASPAKAEAGTTVTITADNVSGKTFKNWTVTSGGAALANASSATTTFTMPSANVAVTANYETAGGETGGETGGDYQDTEIPEGGLVTTEVYGNPAEVKFTVLENMPAKTDQEVAEYDTYYQGDTNPTLSGGIPTEGAAFKIDAAKDATVKFVIRNIGKTTDKEKTYYVVDASGNEISKAGMGSGTIKAVPIEFEMTAGSTYYLYVSGSKVMVYEFGYTVKNTGSNPGENPGENPSDEPKSGLSFEGDVFKYYENDIWVSDKYAFVEFDGARFLVANGTAATHMNGLAQDPEHGSDWYYVAAGKIQEQTQGLVEYDDEWFYVQNGKMDATYNGYATYDGGKFLVAEGRIVREATGLVQDPNSADDWYFLAAGQKVEYTGLAMYDNEWFYVVDGRLAVEYTGNVEYNGETFFVVSGMYRTDLE